MLMKSTRQPTGWSAWQPTGWFMWQPTVPDERMPTGVAVGLGTIAMVAAGMAATLVPVNQPGWRFAVVATAVAVFAATTLDHVALAVVALIGFLISNGFLEDRFGDLSWHGSADLWRLLLLVSAGAVGLAVGEGYRWVRDLRDRWRAELPATPDREATPATPATPDYRETATATATATPATAAPATKEDRGA